MINKVNELENNPKIKEYLKENNKPFSFDDILEYESPGIIGRDVYALMIQLGIPIGICALVNSEGKEVPADDEDFDLDADHSDLKWIYTPINNMDELRKYAYTHRFMDFMRNPNLISAEEIRHLGYLLRFANDDKLFDQYTMNLMQNELIDNAPLKYDVAMEIFNKYYTDEVKDIFINDFGVDDERFYYLSGLDRKEISI